MRAVELLPTPVPTPFPSGRVIAKYGSLETLPRPGNAQANELLKMLGLTSSQYISHYGELDHRSLRLEEGDSQL